MIRILFLLLALTSTATFAKKEQDGSHIQPDNYYPRVLLETTMGNITVELDRRRAPATSNNFLRYVDKRSYEDTIIHRVVAGFVVQGGGYNAQFKEKPSYPPIINESGNGMKNELYTIAMARQNDPHSATRQFYFNMADNESLDPGRNWGYAVFGMVVEGTEVLEAISQVETQYEVMLGARDVPIEPILIKKATILPPL